jgi:nitronate monooxygenase
VGPEGDRRRRGRARGGERAAGGHAGRKSPEALLDELRSFNVPIVSAGGVGTPEEFTRHLRMGYAAVQLGTRFIATPECKASDAYKQAIVDAKEEDIVLTERLTGVPVAVIRNAYIEKLGTDAGWFAKWMLRGRRTKHWMRTWYALNSVRRLKRSLHSANVSTDYWQAGKSVAGIHDVRPAAQIVREFATALD